MFARTTTVIATPATIEAGIGQVRDEVLPAVQALDGCVGLSMLADRASGRCIVTTAWEDERALQASHVPTLALRARVAATFGADPTVQVWEIALLHREHDSGPDACARVVWTRVRPDDVDRQISMFRDALLPQIEAIPGFRSASLLVDRAAGRAAVATTYVDRAALEASRPAGAALRADFLRSSGAEVLEVAELDLVVAHLRVPETV